jgi:hypothetical protein
MPSPKQANRIRMASLGVLTQLIVQFVLGAAYSLDGTFPSSGHSVGMFSSPILAVHVVWGVLLIITAIVVLIRAITTRHGASIGTTVVGLLAILGAWGSGEAYVSNGSHGASFAMALLTAIAMACYAANLVILAKPATQPSRESQSPQESQAA